MVPNIQCNWRIDATNTIGGGVPSTQLTLEPIFRSDACSRRGEHLSAEGDN